jgi:hypothetical protein
LFVVLFSKDYCSVVFSFQSCVYLFHFPKIIMSCSWFSIRMEFTCSPVWRACCTCCEKKLPILVSNFMCLYVKCSFCSASWQGKGLLCIWNLWYLTLCFDCLLFMQILSTLLVYIFFIKCMLVSACKLTKLNLIPMLKWISLSVRKNEKDISYS